MSPHEVLVVGSINQDQILVVDRLPAPGETVLAVRTDRSAGGKGANQAVAVAAGGVRVRLVGAVGADSAGQSVLTSLAERGVDIEGVQVRPGYTGLAVVTVDAQGENSIVVDDDEVNLMLIAIALREPLSPPSSSTWPRRFRSISPSLLPLSSSSTNPSLP